MSRKRSWVWNYAEITEENKKAVCLLCQKHVTYCSSPSTIAKHLKALHMLEPPTNVTNNIDERNVDDADNLLTFEDVKPSKMIKIENETEGNIESEMQECITESIITFVSTTLQPISTVSSKSFQDLMALLKPTYIIPCEQTIQSRLQLSYNKVRGIIENKLNVASDVSLTIEEWYSLTKIRYISVKVQSLDDDCNLQHFTLCDRVIEEGATAINIAESLNSILTDWNLMRKVQAVVHDSESGIQLADNLVETGDKISCAAHLIQQVVKDCFAEIPHYEDVCKKGSKIVDYFQHSNVANEALFKRQEQLEIKQECLVQRCHTRWDSTFYMCQSLLENKNAIEIVLSDRNVTTIVTYENLEISENDWSTMENMIKLLKPFQVAITFLCNEKNVTSSCVMPIIYGLETKHMTDNLNDSDEVQLFKSQAISSLCRRFKTPTDPTALQVSSFLDPRYKTLFHENEITRKRITTFVKNAVTQNSTTQETANDNSSQSDIDFLCPPQPMSLNEIEFERYNTEPQINQNCDPLVWWRQHKDSFPVVFKLAQKYLSIPATSAMSKRLFSTAGNIISQRSCLEPKDVKLLTFLYENRSIMQ